MSEPNIYSVNLNTRFATNYGQAGYLTRPYWLFSESINDISAVKLKSVNFPKSVYSVDSRNNRLDFIEATNTSATLTLTLPSRIYNGLTLADELQTQLNATSTHDYTVNYQTNGSNVLTFSSGTSGNFKFVDSNFSASYETGLDFILNTMGSTFTSGSIDLSGISVIHIASNVGAITVAGQPYKMLGAISTEESNLDICVYEDGSSDYVNANIPSLSEIQLNLFDNRMRQLAPAKDYNLTVNFLIEKY
jgi:hypothetical protein